MPGVVQDGMHKLELTTRQKNTVLDTIRYTIQWYKDLEGAIKNL